ncbi:MAG: TerB family tellurite resistance protein [Maricaulaceae bacterium]
MDPSKWSDVFSLLSIIVIADNRVYKEEVDCFTNHVISLKNDLQSDTLLTRKLALDWFMAHRDAIATELRSAKAEIFISRKILQFADFPKRHLLLDAMYKIAMSDGDLHEREKRIIESAAAQWKLPFPA